MVIKGFISALFIILIISGCASKAEKKFLNEITYNSSRYSQLRQTEKIIFGSNNNEQIVLLTYLRNNNSNNKSNEKFIISVYTDDDNNTNPIKKITEEGHMPICMSKIPRSSLPKGLKRIIPLWFDNYIVEFPYTKLKKFRIIITPVNGKEKSIYFYKDMRYIVDKKKNNKII